MIVRIMSDGQYRLDDHHPAIAAEIERLDDELMQAERAGDEERFHDALARLITQVHRSGQAVSLAELVPSDVMIPAADMSLAETHRLLEQAVLAG